MKTGIELIAKERQEQIEKHGRTVENDVLYNNKNQLLSAAIALLWQDRPPENVIRACTPTGWDEEIFLKMMRKPDPERLVIAGALIAAEIDRLRELDWGKRQTTGNSLIGNM